MKTQCFTLVILLMGFSVMLSQTRTTFKNPQNNVPTTLFDISKTDTIVVTNLESLAAKREAKNFLHAYKAKLFLENLNSGETTWNFKSYNDRALSFPKQDANGRDLPTDVHYEVIQRVYNKTE